MTTYHQTSSKSKFNLYTLKVDWEDGQFFWDEEYINTKELVKEFTDKYGKPIDKYSRKKKLSMPLPFILSAIVNLLKDEYNYSYNKTRELITNLVS